MYLKGVWVGKKIIVCFVLFSQGVNLYDIKNGHPGCLRRLAGNFIVDRFSLKFAHILIMTLSTHM